MTTRLIILVVGCLMLAIGARLAVSSIESQAAAEAVQSIRTQDQEAGDAADSARAGFDGCADGLWDYVAGKCLRAAPRSRN